jgi:phosphatidate cytidylyltransferase
MLVGYGIVLWFCGRAFEIKNYHLNSLSFSISIAGFVMLTLGIFLAKRIDLKSFGTAALGLLYISLTWGLMIDLRQTGMMFKGNHLFLDFGRLYPCLIVFSIWINDTMAYVVGSLVGKIPLSIISPKKTWEGTVGGAVLAITIIGFIGSWLIGTTVLNAVIVAAIASVAGTFGDLFESKLKRMAGEKDSGNIMPGHGGFLDRFDSLLLATPVVWIYVYFLMS